MSDREAFEVFACDMDRDWNITCDLRGDYISAVTSGAWESWQASRQALEGEAVGTARRCGYDRDITYCDFEADEVPIGTKLYTHPASCSEIPDSPATGNAVAMGDLTDNDDEEHERSILIQFASVEDFHGARSSGQCRFTVFGGGV